MTEYINPDKARRIAGDKKVTVTVTFYSNGDDTIALRNAAEVLKWRADNNSMKSWADKITIHREK